MIIKALFGQTLMDIAIERYGSAMSLVDLANDNGLAIDADVYAGQDLIIRETAPDTSISLFGDYLVENEIKVVSGQGGNTQVVTVLATNDDEGLTDNDNNNIQI